MKSTLLFLLLTLAGLTTANAQTPDSCGLRISLLTCGPGEDLYSIFGHSAVRIRQAGRDLVYNYGTMDFEDPAFYLKFMRGEMRYFLSNAPFEDFMMEYRYFGRSVTEQELQLSCADKQRLLSALQINQREENRYYNYSFLYDNCSSRIGDILLANNTSAMRYGTILPPPPPTWRNLIHKYLHRGGQHWSQLGIDLLLGAELDQKINSRQAMFLPDYLLMGLDSARQLAARQPASLESLVAKKQVIYPGVNREHGMGWFNPYLVISLLSILLLIFSFRNNSSRIIDFSVFFITGLLGLLFLTLWIYRQDTVCRDNLNIAWALPTHLVMAFRVRKPGAFTRWYFTGSGVLGALLLLGWWGLPQELNNSLIPFVILLTVRSFVISKKAANATGSRSDHR